MMTPIWRPFRAIWCAVVFVIGMTLAAYHHPYAAVIVTALGMGFDVTLKG
jgi:hypothetical protein